jgi:methylated-DNA-[protein]-cysteine S-methyltransferase
MYLAATDRGLARLSWRQPSPDAFEREIRTRFPGRPIIHDPEALAETERQLREYFSGDRSRFDLPVDLTALSPFERRVLETTRRIPYGQVVPYAELARRIGKPKAARAVGNALGHNPVAIVVPCHRVVRSDGGLGGYTGGVRYKRDLLKIEGRDDLARAS